MAAMSTADDAARVYRVACIGAARMASWFDDVQRERAERDGGRSLEWVPGAIASVCQAIDLAELVAVCDLKPDLVAQMRDRWGVPAGYTDWREMVECERPDIVAIVTSWGSTHAALAAGVAETGLVRGIYCEKPMATSMREADRIVTACREHGVAYSCAHVFRWNARYRQALAWIADGSIGEVRSVVCNAMGTLLHSGTHQADAALGLAGDADLEWASGWADVAPTLPPDQWPQRDPVGGGVVQLASGVQLLFDGRAPGPRVFQVNGTQGTVCLYNDLRQVQRWRRANEPGIVDLAAGPLLAPLQEKSYAVTQMEELIGVLDRGGRTSCDEVRAGRALELVLGLHLSHRRGGERVRFPLQDRTFGVDTV
jgi:predicted dehydrogenase